MGSEKFIGHVCWFDAKLGYGFISRTGEKDIFVHWSDITSEGFKTIKKGQEVAFSVGLNHRQQPKAVDIVVVNSDDAEVEDTSGDKEV